MGALLSVLLPLPRGLLADPCGGGAAPSAGSWVLATALPDLQAGHARDAVLAFAASARLSLAAASEGTVGVQPPPFSEPLLLLAPAGQDLSGLFRAHELDRLGIQVVAVPRLPDPTAGVRRGLCGRTGACREGADGASLLLPLQLFDPAVAGADPFCRYETVVFLAADNVVVFGESGSALGRALARRSACPLDYQCLGVDPRSPLFASERPPVGAGFDPRVMVLHPRAPAAAGFLQNLTRVFASGYGVGWEPLLRDQWASALRRKTAAPAAPERCPGRPGSRACRDYQHDLMRDFDARLWFQSAADVWNLALSTWGCTRNVLKACRAALPVQALSGREVNVLADRLTRSELASTHPSFKAGITSFPFAHEKPARARALRWSLPSPPPWLGGPRRSGAPLAAVGSRALVLPIEDFAECSWRQHRSLAYRVLGLAESYRDAQSVATCSRRARAEWRYHALADLAIAGDISDGWDGISGILLTTFAREHKPAVFDGWLMRVVRSAALKMPLPVMSAVQDELFPSAAESLRQSTAATQGCCRDLLIPSQDLGESYTSCENVLGAEVLASCPLHFLWAMVTHQRYALFFSYPSRIHMDEHGTRCFHTGGLPRALLTGADWDALFEAAAKFRIATAILNEFAPSHACPPPSLETMGLWRGRALSSGGAAAVDSIDVEAVHSWKVMPQAIGDEQVQARSMSDAFTFGRNWMRYVDAMTMSNLWGACEDLRDWLGGSGSIQGRRVLDIGCGSGVHSLCFVLFGAASVFSFDYDATGVEATRKLREQTGTEAARWQIEHGSALDREWMESLGRFDIVYSWGVLHHTGSMWEAVYNAVRAVSPADGLLYIALYLWHPAWRAHDLAAKLEFSELRTEGERLAFFESFYGVGIQGTKSTTYRRGRGMHPLANKMDWLGGIPYEVARPDDVRKLLLGTGAFREERSEIYGEQHMGFCNTYLFRRLQ